MAYYGAKRKVFISFYQGDQAYVDAFIAQWSTNEGVFITKSLGTSDNDDFIDSDNPEYVMSQIRKRYLEDSTVTIVLVGRCTHSRRYVDWETKASLTQGQDLPNGLIAITLPYTNGSAHLPPRVKENWNSQVRDCYARYYSYPTSAQELGGWIEDAYQARLLRAKHIQNSQDMMRYNANCHVCGTTH
jgi:hypothetical protein